MIVEIAVDRILVKSATFIIFAGAAADGQRLIVASSTPRVELRRFLKVA